MKNKTQSRIRRGKKVRMQMRRLGKNRLIVHRTPRHIYAQIASVDNEIIASASTLEADVKSSLPNTGNVDAASAVGKLIAERAQEKGVDNIAFDRSGFKYHGRIKALADAAREAGLEF